MNQEVDVLKLSKHAFLNLAQAEHSLNKGLREMADVP
jgi:hypothetical protein